jgi:hypothetical protein
MSGEKSIGQGLAAQIQRADSGFDRFAGRASRARVLSILYLGVDDNQKQHEKIPVVLRGPGLSGVIRDTA